jgi:hypothetical protein
MLPAKGTRAGGLKCAVRDITGGCGESLSLGEQEHNNTEVPIYRRWANH